MRIVCAWAVLQQSGISQVRNFASHLDPTCQDEKFSYTVSTLSSLPDGVHVSRLCCLAKFLTYQQDWFKTSCPAMPLSHTCKQAHTIYKLYKGLDWKSFKLKLAKVYTFYHIVGSTNPLRHNALYFTCQGERAATRWPERPWKSRRGVIKNRLHS